MGGSGTSREKFNARETVLSSDFNRLQMLASRDLQSLMADASADLTGLPISGLSGPCTLAGIPSSFLMALPAAQAFFYNPGDSTLTADDSAYELVRWATQNLTFAGPAGQPRIDLVVATPAMADADSQSRNILLDPTARTISPQNVFKTTNPLATITVVAGTPGATPAPPAVPAGAVALLEVYVPTGASDSTAFGVVPRLFRRAPHPWATSSFILSGFTPKWDLSVDPATTSSTLSFEALADCRALIDGELLEALGAIIPVSPDAGGNNPFAAAAAANWHKPYYLYAVGGRHCPQGGVSNSPMAIVESLVPPLSTTGRPTAAITTPRGTTTQAGALYIGLGFVVANSTRRLACVMDEEFTNLTAVSVLGPANFLSHVATSAAFEACDLHAPPVVPAISTLVKAQLVPGTTVSNGVFAAPDNGAGTAAAIGYGTGYVQPFPPAQTVTGPVQIDSTGVLPVNPAAPKFWILSNAGAGTNGLAIMGFEHKVRRLHY